MTYSPPDSALFAESSSLDSPARTSPFSDTVRAWTEHARDSSSRSFASHATFGPGGSSWRTSLAYCLRSVPAPAVGSAAAAARQLTLFPAESAGDPPAAVPAAAWRSTGEQWVPSSGRWETAGMGSPTECWTLPASVLPNNAVASSLSDVLETGPHLQRYCLSPKAAAGMLRRGDRRGLVLAGPLRRVLEALAGSPTP